MRFKDKLHDPGCTIANKHHTLSGKARGHDCRYAARKFARKMVRNKMMATPKVVDTNAIQQDAGTAQ